MASRFRPRQTVSAHLPASRRAAGSVDRLLGSALELRAVRVARIRGGRGQLPRHDGLFNPVNMAGTTEELWFVDWEFGGTPYANRALYEKWSPLNFVQNWKTP